MAKPTDRDRLLWLLNEEGGTSNQQAKTILNVSDQRYGRLKDELLGEALIEKYRCRSGGISLTAKGVKHLAPSPESAVGKEADLYEELVNVIDHEAYDNEENAFGFDIGSLRNRGKWTNPDVVKFSVRNYPRQRIDKLIVTTYEVKQWRRWNVEAVYEAASHRKFAHEAYVVLEWAKGAELEGLEVMESACSRFGVGLITLHKHYSGFRKLIQLEAVPNVPSEDDVEDFLEYVLSRKADADKAFADLWTKRGVA
ncbi:hypothetical protein [Pandoraea sp. ISTKB]|uniref:hypothetical protein n=1 Tax=Pandoraea sp. ISTKB TaxID=1586708 RepID=UPI001112D411|nr:hypothetical protein [Pandoraea sp. ISTKB]